MKKLLFLLSVVLLPMYANAQKIVKDIVNKDNSRIISTSYGRLYTKTASGGNVGLALFLPEGGEPSYLINLELGEGDLSVNEGQIMAVKLSNGEIIEVKCVDSDNEMVKFLDISHYPFHYVDRTYLSYNCDKATISKIAESEVVKIRIESTDGYIDRNIKGNKMSKFISKSLQLFEELLKKGAKSRYSDF